MDDAELSRIRAARLAELQGSGVGVGGGGGKGSDGEDKDSDASQRHAQLSQILAPEARDRLRRIALVKADRARSIEELLLRMARSGQIRQRVSEAELVGLLTEVADQDGTFQSKTSGGSRSGIVNLRRADDSDDDWS